MNDILKCLKCGHVLIQGNGTLSLIGKGIIIQCRKCGNIEKKMNGVIKEIE